MIGLGVLLFLLIWAGLSLLIANLISKKLLKRFTKDDEGRTTSKGVLLILLITVLVFFMPIADELIAYPRLQRLCEGAGAFQFSPEIDEKKVLGKEIYSLRAEEYIMLFPKLHTLTSIESQNRTNEQKLSGVIAVKSIDSYVDAKTGKVLFSIKSVKPITSLFAIPTDSGNRSPWVLRECGFFGYTKGKRNPEFYKSLQLREVEAPVNNYTLKEE